VVKKNPQDMINVGEGNNTAEEEPPQDPTDEIDEDALNADVRDMDMEDLIIQFPSLSISEDAEDNVDALNILK
jgi:hypothetical protein